MSRSLLPAAAARVGLAVLLVSLQSFEPASSAAGGQPSGGLVEDRFQTGCDPGPYHAPPWPDPLETHRAAAGPPVAASMAVDQSPADAGRPILGTGFDMEHALWSCSPFRPLLQSTLLDPFQPAIARVDTGLLPAAPPELDVAQLGPHVYRSVLESAPYADSWDFMRRLNQAGVRVVLGVWGGPDQFTDDGTRRGLLEPEHYDDYVTYVATLVDFLVHDQGVQVWAITIANEPDGGDGNQIPPEGLAYIAHRLALRLGPEGVKLYGPDTTNSADAMLYLPGLLDDPVIASDLAFVAMHQYDASPDVATVVDYVHARQPDLPVVVTEYTSFDFGDLDDGQDANDSVGFTLDVVNTVLSHFRLGVDAALYWDAVDYLQPGHDAVTKWGLLRGPARDFSKRTRYFGLLQVLPYLGSGAQVLDSRQDGSDDLSSLAIKTSSGETVIILDNRGVEGVDLQLGLHGGATLGADTFNVWRTDRLHEAELIGQLHTARGSGELMLPGRSLTTLVPAPRRGDSTDPSTPTS